MKKKKVAIGVVVILLVCGSVWAWMSRPDAQVEKVKQLLAEGRKEGQTPEQQRQSFQAIREEMRNLTPEQREVVMEPMIQERERHEDKRMIAYFAMPKAQRNEYLDKEIKAEEKRAKDMAARRAQSNRSGNQANAQRQGGGPPGGGRNMNPEARQQRQNAQRDKTTSQQRAMRAAYAADKQLRRTQLGLPATSGRGGFGGPGGGRRGP